MKKLHQINVELKGTIIDETGMYCKAGITDYKKSKFSIAFGEEYLSSSKTISAIKHLFKYAARPEVLTATFILANND